MVAQPVAHAALGEALGRALDSAPQLEGDLPPLEVEALQPRLHLAAEVGSGVGLGLGFGFGFGLGFGLGLGDRGSLARLLHVTQLHVAHGQVGVVDHLG